MKTGVESAISDLKAAVDRGDWPTVARISEMLEWNIPVEPTQPEDLWANLPTDGTSRHWPPALAKIIFERDDGHCVYCGNLAIEIDHVVPVSWGGPTMKNNGVCTCHRCNCVKSNRSEVDMITQGIFWLLQQGEDMSWVDTFQPSHRWHLGEE